MYRNKKRRSNVLIEAWLLPAVPALSPFPTPALVLNKLNYPMLGLIAQVTLSPLLLLARLLGILNWSWAAVIVVPMLLAGIVLLLGLLDYLMAQADADVSFERKRSSRHIF